MVDTTRQRVVGQSGVYWQKTRENGVSDENECDVSIPEKIEEK